MTERLPTGEWAEPSVVTARPWIGDPLTRHETARTAPALLVLGSSGMNNLKVFRGTASSGVTSLEVRQGDRAWQASVNDACGAFLVGAERPGTLTLRALDEHRRPLDGPAGRPVRLAMHKRHF